MSEEELTSGIPPSSTASVPIDRGVVRDALREILEEIPSFRALRAAGSSSSGAAGSGSAVSTTPASTVAIVTPSPLEGGKFS